MVSICSALNNFKSTLMDDSVTSDVKLQILVTLNEVSLTIDELTKSGIAKAVSSLKYNPGSLGNTSRSLVKKWKLLLKSELKQSNLDISQYSQSKKIPINHTEPGQTEVTNSTKIRVDTESKQIKIEPNCSPPPTSEQKKLLQKASSQSSLNENTTPGNLICKKRSRPESSNSNNTTHQPRLFESNDILPAKKSKSTPHITSTSSGSIDSSSGMSFMESLNVAMEHPVKKRRALTSKPSDISSKEKPKTSESSSPLSFTDEILSSLNEPFERPDAVNDDRVKNSTSNSRLARLDIDDGDLKFKSEKRLWVPKSKQVGVQQQPKASSATLNSVHQPPTLLATCLEFIRRNLDLVDCVGTTPFELLQPILIDASPDSLKRIEHHNPHFIESTDELWKRHALHHLSQSQRSSRRPNESWRQFYWRVRRDEQKRLSSLICKAQERVRSEEQNKRKMLSTEAIAPRRFRNAAKSSSAGRVPDQHHQQPTKLPRPYDASHPSCNQSRPSISAPTNTNSGPVKKIPASTGLMAKLRKQFNSRHLR